MCRRTNAEILQGRQRQRREDSKLSSSLLHFLGNTRDQQHVFNTPQQEEATDTNQSNWTHVKTRDKGYKPRQFQEDYDGNEIESDKESFPRINRGKSKWLDHLPSPVVGNDKNSPINDERSREAAGWILNRLLVGCLRMSL